MDRKISVVEDLEGRKTVFIHDIKFKGKRMVDWKEVEEYLKEYVGEFYEIEDCNVFHVALLVRHAKDGKR